MYREDDLGNAGIVALQATIHAFNIQGIFYAVCRAGSIILRQPEFEYFIFIPEIETGNTVERIKRPVMYFCIPAVT